MANLSITPANVKASSAALAAKKTTLAGTTIAAGDVIYKDSATKKMLLSDADGEADAQKVDGVALNGASADQPLVWVEKDAELDLGVTVGSGQVIVLSKTPGKMAPDADITSGGRKVVLAVGVGGTKVSFSPVRGGVV